METPFKSDKILEGLKDNRSRGADKKQAAKTRYLIFSLSSNLFAITGENVREVNSINTIYFFPHVDSWLKGLVNLRGEVHSIISLKEALSLDDELDEEMMVLYSSKQITTAMAIDDIIDVIDVSPEEITPYGESEHEDKHIRGVLLYKDREAVIIDIDILIESLRSRIAESAG